LRKVAANKIEREKKRKQREYLEYLKKLKYVWNKEE